MTGVFVLISFILAGVLVGGLIPQGMPAEVYMDHYGTAFGKLFLLLGLDDVFHTRGFAALGLLLFGWLSICTLRRMTLLRRDMKRWIAGSVILHVGLLVFLLSVGVSLIWGSSTMVEVPEGKTILQGEKNLPFELKLEKFTIEYYPQDRNAVKQYRSEVSLLQNGVTVKQGALEVNEPLEYKGTKIYQMSYGWLLELKVRRLPDGQPQGFSVQNGEWISFGKEGKDKLRVVLMADPERMWATKPEAGFLILEDGKSRRMGAVAIQSKTVSGDIEIQFDGLRRFSGFQVKQDPGIPGIFGGFIIALIGLALRYIPEGKDEKQ